MFNFDFDDGDHEDPMELFYNKEIAREWIYREERKLFLDDEGELPSFDDLSQQQLKELQSIYDEYKDTERFHQELKEMPR